MRLVCPNCGAQYEVPDDVIPEDGRDVQCSNCGHTWFQTPSGAEEIPQPDDQAAVWTSADDDEAPEDEPLPEEPQAQAPKRRGLDPAIADILREEAEHEARVRAAETLEEQPELGLQDPEDEVDRRARQSRERMQRMRGELPDDEESAAEAAAAAVVARPRSRSDMLPDIEEINQTLRSENERRDVPSMPDTDTVEPGGRGGFGRGFAFVILLFALATAVYAFAPQIKEQVPQAAQALDTYVLWVNQLRVWLDTQLSTLRDMIGGMTQATKPSA